MNLAAIINDDEETIQTTSAFMVQSSIPVDPPSPIQSSESDKVISVKAHFGYSMHPYYRDRVYAISDGGADSCILGKNAKVVSYTG